MTERRRGGGSQVARGGGGIFRSFIKINDHFKVFAETAESIFALLNINLCIYNLKLIFTIKCSAFLRIFIHDDN